MKQGALVLSVGGTLAALVGSIGVSWAPWASRTMLVTNLVVIAGSLLTAFRARRAVRAPSVVYTWKPILDDRVRKHRFGKQPPPLV